MEDNDDDYFSDDFDSLPPGTLFELEQSAFQATQAHATQKQNDQYAQNTPAVYQRPQPARGTSTTLKPPPRLHTGLTNDYDTLEVGELEAEVYDNGVGQAADLPQDHQIVVTDHGWPLDGAMDDMMDVDEDEQPQGNLHEWSAHLEKVRLALCAIPTGGT